ncbi:hypothetical protein IQ07DRAFT_591790 [Pyrenochaeta sp. DS3sAY3a]|nr:hypothetical protein IQ07DRAFT_591790 [Pyrenochaeta sp. DS3sAY3a]
MPYTWSPTTRIKDDAIHLDDLQISFHRTLRVPDNRDSSKLPPSLGRFSLYNAVDYAEQLPRNMVKKGGAFLSMYRREAVWIKFVSKKPYAVRLYVGGVNAVSGKPIESSGKSKAESWDGSQKWAEDETQHWKQDYMVVPRQKWIDGIATQPGVVQQFVAMPTGSGYSVELQVTGKENFAGMLFSVTPMRPRLERLSVKMEVDSNGMPEERPITVPVCLDDTIDMARRTVWERGKQLSALRPLDAYDLLLSDLVLQGTRTLESYGIDTNSTLSLKVKPGKWWQPKRDPKYRENQFQGVPVPPYGHIQYNNIFVRDVDDITYSLDLLSQIHTVDQMADYLGATRGIDTSDYRFIYKGKMLLRERTLGSYGIKDGATIQCVLRLPGGGAGPPPWYKETGTDETVTSAKIHEMGIAAGGRIDQVIEADPKTQYWSGSKSVWFNVQILNSSAFSEVTGLPPPQTPVNPELYAKHGYPFYELWGEEMKKPVAGDFRGVKTIAQIDGKIEGNLNLAKNVLIKEERFYQYNVNFFQDSEEKPEFRSVEEWERYFA